MLEGSRRGGQASRVERAETKRAFSLLIITLVVCATCGAVASPLAVAANQSGRSSQSRQLGQIRRIAVAQAKRNRGLPPGISLPSWTKHDQNAYLLPTPFELRRDGSSQAFPRGDADEESTKAVLPSDTPFTLGSEEGTNEAGRRCTGSYCPDIPLRYLGGDVQHEVEVHVIFWGSSWSEETNAAAKKDVLSMFEGLSESSYQEILTQYFDPAGRISAHVSVDSFTDSRLSAPEEVTYSSMAPEIAYALGQKEGWQQGPDAQFILLPAPGTVYDENFNGFCAYHDIDSDGDVYSVVPYAGDPPFGTSANCDGYYGRGDAGKATSLMASHEYAESATDPRWSTKPGWKDRQGYEVGDICATPYDELSNGTFVQGEWDDHQNQCSIEDEAPPHVLTITEPPSEVTTHSATLSGVVNPESLETTYHFEYGPTLSYGSSSPAEPLSAGSGREDVMVSTELSSLTLGEVYHYRLVASNETGVSYGADRTVLPSIWTVQLNSDPEATAASWLNEVSCATEGSCIAVGHHYPGRNRAVSYIGHGSNWEEHMLPTPTLGVFHTLTGVSCASASACTAVGYKEHEGYRPIAAYWNGSEWTIQDVPDPEESTYAELLDVSCPTAGNCIGVGYYKDPNGSFTAYSAKSDGGVWSNLVTPKPEEGGDFELHGVSCVSLEFCVAVGRYANGGYHKMILRWNGSTWEEEEPATGATTLEDIDCLSGKWCMAVGSSGSTAAAETWNGSEWSYQTADPQGGGSSSFDGVSCSAADSCVAVGSAASGIAGGSAYTLAESWNGTGWQVQSTPRESETDTNYLSDVDCIARARCVSVGASAAGGFYEPLIETYATASPPQLVSSFGSTGSGNGQVNHPAGTAVDAQGNVWVVDKGNDRIEKFDAEGEYLAQIGEAGSGNGQLENPTGIAIDGEGDIWVTDTGNHRLEKFSPEGEYLGQYGTYGGGDGQFKEPKGIAVAPDGHVWVADAWLARVTELTSSGEFVRNVTAGFSFLSGVAVDSEGDVWVADQGNSRMVKLSPEGNVRDEFGSNGEEDGQFKNPSAVAIMPSGNLLVADRFTNRVQEFSSTGEYLTQFSSGRESEGIAMTNHGEIYVTNHYGANKVEKWAEPGRPTLDDIEATETGSGRFTLSAAANPHGVDTTYQFEYGPTTGYGSSAPAVAQEIGSGFEEVEVADELDWLPAGVYHYKLVARNDLGVAESEDMTFVARQVPAYRLSFGSKGSGNGQFSRPKGMAVDAEGNVWVADSGNNRLEKFTSEGEYLAQFGESGNGNGQLSEPNGVAIDEEGNLWVAETGNSRVQEFSPAGEYLSQFGSYGSNNGQFKQPSGIAIAPDGNVWVLDYWLGCVSEFTPGGEFVRKVTGFGFVHGIAIDPAGHVWIASQSHSNVVELSSEGQILSEFGSNGEGDGQFKNPTAIGILPSGALLVADRFGGRVQEVSAEGTYIAKFAEGQLSEPEGMTIDSGGGIYVSNTYGSNVKKWADPGKPIAGTAPASEVGEGGATLKATVDPHGADTTYQFEYGTNTEYGSRAPVLAEDAGSGTSDVQVGVPIGGLQRATTYHYRVVATNEFGTMVGEDKAFTTIAPTPAYQLSFGSKGSGDGQFEGTGGLAIDEEGNVWVADKGNDRVQEFTSEGKFLFQFGETGSEAGELNEPNDIVIDEEGNLWVTDRGNSRVEEFTPEGEFLSQFGSYGGENGQFKQPVGIAISPDGHIWVSDYWLARVSEFTANGEFVREAIPGFSWLGGLAVDSEGRVWVDDRGHGRVVELSPEGEVLGEFGSTGKEAGQFEGGPTSIAVVPSGSLLVGERYAPYRVQEFSNQGGYLTQFGEGRLNGTIEGIATDSSGAVIYVASGNSVQEWVEP